MHSANQALEDGEIDDDVALEPQVCRSKRNSLLCISRLVLGLKLYLHEANMAPLRHAAQAPEAERAVATTRHP